MIVVPCTVQAQSCGGTTYKSSGGTCVPCETASYTPTASNAASCSPCTQANGQCASSPEEAGVGLYMRQSHLTCAEFLAQKDCTACQLCDSTNQREITIWPCLNKLRSSDTVKCMPRQDFMDIEGNLNCPSVGQYLDLSPVPAKIWNPSDLLAPSPNGRFFAECYRVQYVKIYEPYSLERPLASGFFVPPVMQFFEAETASSTPIFKSITWSLDGNSLYVLTANASIMLMTVWPIEARGIVKSWSPAPTVSASGEDPCQASSSRSMCVAMPQASMYASVQIALICSFDICSSGNRLSYLVRILSDGRTRLVNQNHRATKPATGLMYNASGNVLYWSVYDDWTGISTTDITKWATSSTRRKVLQVDLSVDYNIVSIHNFTFARPLGLAIGSTFEAAAIMPRSNILFCYLPTSSTLVELFLFDRDGNYTKASSSSSRYAPLKSFPTTGSAFPSRVFFMDNGRFFLQRPGELFLVEKYGECVGAFQFFSLGFLCTY